MDIKYVDADLNLANVINVNVIKSFLSLPFERTIINNDAPVCVCMCSSVYTI